MGSARPLPPPDPSPCWTGAWVSPDGQTELWLLAAVLRTVGALPRLHPWRLGDEQGRSRVVQWAGRPEPGPGRPGTFAVLTAAARDPNLPTGDQPDPDDVLAAVAGWAVGAARVAVGNAVADPRRAPRWAGAVARLPGCWLPPLAVLPRADRGVDDPGTRWDTESADFAARHTVHAADTRYAAGVLAPHVMALVLDVVPDRAAVTLAGDALHVWWPYPLASAAPTSGLPRVTDAVAGAAALADALPTFLATDHPDRSSVVEEELAGRARAAAEYRRTRRPGTSTDPVLQAMYARARAAYGLGDVAGS
ncbi:MAG: hypothetical protein MUC45_02585 [Actinomycetia bacterium]|jgi:hypothetical protein|nr:hypothetical protein [Actinomycetes bacterium]